MINSCNHDWTEVSCRVGIREMRVGKRSFKTNGFSIDQCNILLEKGQFNPDRSF